MPLADNMLGTVIDGRYRLREFIGSGAFGHVFAADELTLGRVISQVAVKIITPENSEQHQNVMTEVVGLAGLTHDYVIAYRSSGEVREGPMAGSLFLATELGDTNLSKLQKASQRLSDDEFRELLRGVASALGHIHAAGAVHGDVKAANLFRVKGRWKLGDLGLMRIARRKPTGPAHGSLNYLAPESLRHEFAPANDMYSLGVTVLHYFSGKYAHEGRSREEFAENLQSLPPRVPPYLREPWRTLVTHCLRREPDERPTALQFEAIVASGSTRFPATDPSRTTLIVSAAGHGQFTSIQAAIDAAPAGARILVWPGKYRDSMHIDKSLEISGDGPPDEVIVSTRDRHCLDVATERPVLIRGLTLRVRPGQKGVECYAVDIGRGKPVLKDCSIHSDTLACIAVHDGADPHLKRCSIFGSRDAGVFVYDGGKGSFETCEIFGNGGTGIAVTEGGAPTFEGCRIHDNKAGGAAVFSGGRGDFEDCDVTANGKAAVTVAGNATIRNCRLTGNEEEAVVLKEGAQVEVTGCDLTGNGRGPWRLPNRHHLERHDNREA